MISCSVDLMELLRCSEWGEAELTNKFVKNGFVEAFAVSQPLLQLFSPLGVYHSRSLSHSCP